MTNDRQPKFPACERYRARAATVGPAICVKCGHPPEAHESEPAIRFRSPMGSFPNTNLSPEEARKHMEDIEAARESDLSPCPHGYRVREACHTCAPTFTESPLGDKLCQSCGSSACCNEQANRGATYPDSPDEANNAPYLMARIDDLEAERDAVLAQIRECGENRTAEAKRCADAEAERDALRAALKVVDGIAREYLQECSDYSQADEYVERIRRETRNV